MSKTTPENTSQVDMPPSNEPTSELTGTLAVIHTELTKATDALTVAELAPIAGVTASSVRKALSQLEARGLAVHTPGRRDGGRRLSNRWRAVPGEAGADATEAPADAQADPRTATSASQNTTDDGGETTAAPDGHTTSDERLARLPEAEVPRPRSVDIQPVSTANSPAGTAQAEAGARDSVAAEPAPAAQAAGASGERPTGGVGRLAPGALRELVIGHLRAHPGEAFTATKISRVIERSSGAIANALVTLVKQGLAEQVSDAPRTYRLSASGDGEK
ncbi:hypothetical protein [Streptomyces sp. NPDC050560]|uniref:hypothetical protein n=1 Tax=Streptomyces sp. NPDC050560 TaxID=3365630 RepID=UPI0037ACBF06